VVTTKEEATTKESTTTTKEGATTKAAMTRVDMTKADMTKAAMIKVDMTKEVMTKELVVVLKPELSTTSLVRRRQIFLSMRATSSMCWIQAIPEAGGKVNKI